MSADGAVADARVGDLLRDPVAALDAWGGQVPELRAMAGCPQPTNHHSEGDVWAHTRLSLEMLTTLPEAVAEHAGDALRDVGHWPLALPARTLTQTVAVLLHDVGKPSTRAGPEGSWTYHGHPRVGAHLARQIVAREGWAAAAARQGVRLDVERLAWLVDDHLFWLNTDVDRVTDRALARRFVDDPRAGDDLRVLSWCDTLGSRGHDGRPHIDLLVAGEVRIAEVRAQAATPDPPPAIRGGEIMELLGIPPGPRVGAVVRWVTRQGLRGDPACALVRQERAWLRRAPVEEIAADLH